MFRNLVRTIAFGVALIALPQIAGGIQITIGPADSFVFQNPDPRTATDFDVKLLTLTGPGIDVNASSGGDPFPNALFGGPKVDGGWGSMTFKGGPGVPSGGTYSMSFEGWPEGTMFDVTFSYPPPPNPLIKLLNFGNFPTDGYVYATPEPSSLALSAAGVFACIGIVRRRLL
jgi:hypothetical protein